MLEGSWRPFPVAGESPHLLSLVWVLSPWEGVVANGSSVTDGGVFGYYLPDCHTPGSIHPVRWLFASRTLRPSSRWLQCLRGRWPGGSVSGGVVGSVQSKPTRCGWLLASPHLEFTHLVATLPPQEVNRWAWTDSPVPEPLPRGIWMATLPLQPPVTGRGTLPVATLPPRKGMP